MLNFSGEPITGTVRSEHLPPGRGDHRHVHRASRVGTVDDLHSFSVALEAYDGTSLLVTPAAEPAQDAPAA